MNGPARNWTDVRRVLCIRLDNMGDVLMSTPAIRALKQGGRHVTLMTSPSGGALADHLPDVDDVIVYEAAWMKTDQRGCQNDLAMLARLRAARFDAAVIFTVYSQSALPAAMMCHLAGIARVLAHVRENPYQLVSNWVRETEPAEQVRHEVQRQLDLVAHVGAVPSDTRLSFHIREQDHREADRVLHAAGVSESHGWIALHSGATAPSRRYPEDQYARALTLLRGEGRRILLLGGTQDADLKGHLAPYRQHLPGLIDLCGALSLGALASVIGRSSVLICNNSGPAHIAAALDVPIVDLYALTNPQHSPWRATHRLLFHDVPCKHCYKSVCPEGHHACLTGVSPARVAQAASALIAHVPAVRAPMGISL